MREEERARPFFPVCQLLLGDGEEFRFDSGEVQNFRSMLDINTNNLTLCVEIDHQAALNLARIHARPRVPVDVQGVRLLIVKHFDSLSQLWCWDTILALSGSGSVFALSPGARLAPPVLRLALLIKPQEARRIVVEDIALLPFGQEVARLDGFDSDA